MLSTTAHAERQRLRRRGIFVNGDSSCSSTTHAHIRLFGSALLAAGAALTLERTTSAGCETTLATTPAMAPESSETPREMATCATAPGPNRHPTSGERAIAGRDRKLRGAQSRPLRGRSGGHGAARASSRSAIGSSERMRSLA
eukprot:5343644-Pleurochrysis_carterae.AAC.3